MSIALSTEDFDRLVGILAAQEGWRTERGRLELVDDVLAGSPRKNDLLGSLDLGGAPRGCAIRLINKLTTFGQDQPGREVLGVLINKLLTTYVGASDDSLFMRGLFTRYAFDALPVANTPALGGWKGGEDRAGAAEKVFGENTLRHVSMLDILLDASRAVVRIQTRDELGTGFMIAPDLLMTNNHVLTDAAVAAGAEYQFNYQLGRNGKALPMMIVRALANGLFHTNPYDDTVSANGLDYSVVQLDLSGTPVPVFAPLKLQGKKLAKDDRVAIIQHPGGDYKKISMQNNNVAYADGLVVQYVTSTMPGSSGSPVLVRLTDESEEMAVVALHHAGGHLVEPGTGKSYDRNEGISMLAILADLKQHAPAIAAKL